MRRGALALLALLLLLLAPAASARTRALLTTCEPGVAEFTGRMDARADAVRMRMRFTLQSRADEDEAWEKVAAGWGEWIDSEAERLVWTKRVEGLEGPAEFRVKVRFRWLDADEELVAHRRRFSSACEQASP